MSRSSFAFLSLSLLASACSGPARYARTDPPAFALAVWTDADRLPNRQDALKACAEWTAKGVVCSLTDDGRRADIRVRATPSTCVPGPDGLIVLALAYPGGLIEVRTDCLKDGGVLDAKKFRAVLTHEIGHQIGIWDHVQVQCDGKEPKHCNGAPVCGPAVMNPTVDRDVDYVTETDGPAFDLRKRAWSALEKFHPERNRLDTLPPVPARVYLIR